MKASEENASSSTEKTMNNQGAVVRKDNDYITIEGHEGAVAEDSGTVGANLLDQLYGSASIRSAASPALSLTVPRMRPASPCTQTR